MLLVGFLAGSVFGATALWLFQDSGRSSSRLPLGAEGGVNTPSTPVTLNDAMSRVEEPEAREREGVAPLSEEFEESHTASRRPLADSSGFDVGALEGSGFSTKDIGWFHERWEQAQVEKRYLADLKARGEDPPRGGGYSDIERELREDLRDDGYDAMLYATNQNNRVALERVRNDGVASRAGIRDGSVVWSYDGQRVFRPKELAKLSTTGRRGEAVEIVIVTRDGTQQLFVERNPLGAELVSAKAQPHPN